MSDQWVAVARILRPHGIHGGMRVEVLSDNPRRLKVNAELWLRGEKHRITSVKQSRQFLVLEVEGIATPEEAEAYRGEYFEIPRDQLEELPANRFYCFELVGMRVKDEQDNPLGEVLDAYTLGSADMLDVRLTNGKTILIPLIADVIVSMDRQQRTVVVRRIMLEDVLG